MNGVYLIADAQIQWAEGSERRVDFSFEVGRVGSSIPFDAGSVGRQDKVDRCARKEHDRALMGWIERRGVH
jgi:hypothetical protein